MKITGSLIIITVAVLAFSCKRGGRQVKEIKDKDVTLQISALKDNDDENLNYKARLTFDKQMAESMTMSIKNNFYYRMDSCFYTVNNGTKQYALLVQPIANGVSNSYEYLLQFEQDQTTKGDSISIVYQDRYISHKQYQLEISKK